MYVMYVVLYVCMYVRKYVCIYVCMYILDIRFEAHAVLGRLDDGMTGKCCC